MMQAADPPAAPPPAEPGAAPAPEAPADTAPATIPSDLDRLAEALPAEHRMLQADGADFDVFVNAITGGPPKGALVLIPGDGGLPPTSDGLTALRRDLPAHGWSTWLISLLRPPRVQSVSDTPDAAAPAATTQSPDAGSTAPAEPAEAKPAAQQEADFPEPAAAPGLDARITAQMQDWITANQPRIAAAVAEAAKEGPVTLVAEGAAAALVTNFMAAGAPEVVAVVLIDPVELPGADARWPEDFATPVLEVLDAEERADIGRERRTLANASRVASYRQLTLPGGYQTEEGQPSVLAKRIRGWLLKLPPAPPAKSAPAQKKSPASLGPMHS